MKKVVFVILTLFFINNVEAMEYSEYGDFGPYTEKYIQSDNLTDVKVERRYQYYKLNKTLGDYQETTTPEYPYIDKEDFIYTDYSQLNPTKPEEKENRIIESIDGYRYKREKRVNYVTLGATTTSMTFSNIKILYKDKEIEYTLEPNVDLSNVHLETGQTIKFKFNEELEYKDLTISFDMKDAVVNKSNVHLAFGINNITYGIMNYSFTGKNSLNIMLKNFVIPYRIYEYVYSEEPLDLNLVEELKLYKYKDKLYRTYNLEKEYYKEYLTDSYGDYIYIDKTKYKDYYAKRVRTILPEPLTNEITKEPEINEIKDYTKNNYKITNINTKEKVIEESYYKPDKNNYYPININKISHEKPQSMSYLLYVSIPFILILGILILVLSKLYKNKKERAKVKKG